MDVGRTLLSQETAEDGCRRAWGLGPLFLVAALALSGCLHEPPACGDGEVDELEECDDSNTSSGDGCSATCTLEDEAVCGDGVVDSGEACDDGNSSDTDACLNGCVQATCGDGIVQAGVETCDDANTSDTDDCVACVDAACGDGAVHAGAETCDDGNLVDGDGCDSDCTPTACGNGVVTPPEECDDGDSASGDGCTAGCLDEFCGDGTVNDGGAETCDDGNAATDDDCAMCEEAFCGDGFVEAGVEACDDANAADTDACIDCVAAACGDGFVQGGVETCDDGNTESGDCCDAACAFDTSGGCGCILTGTVMIPLPASGVAFGDTTGGAPLEEGTCTGGASGPEDVYVLDLPYTAEVRITTFDAGTGAPLNTALYVRTDCADPASELGCDDDGGSGLQSQLIFAALAPQLYFIYVDGMAGASGPYYLGVSGTWALGAPCEPAGSPIFNCDTLGGEVCAPSGAGYTCQIAECSDLADNDGDALVDYPADPGCYSALWTEVDACASASLLAVPTDGHVLGSLATAVSAFEGSCEGGFVSSYGAEHVYVLNVPGDSTVTIDSALPGTTVGHNVYARSSCVDAGTEDFCATLPYPGTLTTTSFVSAGTHYLFVDARDDLVGSYEMQISGVVANGQPCDPSSLVFSCDAAAGRACVDLGTGFACTLMACADGVDNDGDGAADHPLDPGCSASLDPDEGDACPSGPGCPACGNATDDDGDLDTDYPADPGCTAAADDDENSCLFGFTGGAMGWTFVNSCAGAPVGWTVDSSESFSPPDALYYGDPAVLNYYCPDGSSTGTATSPPIALPAGGATASFHLWGESAPCSLLTDYLTLWVVPAAGPAVQVWDRCEHPETADLTWGAWVMQAVDLSAFAGQTVQLQFLFESPIQWYAMSRGWYVDDLNVDGICP